MMHLSCKQIFKLFFYFNRKFINKLSDTGIGQRDCPVKLNFTVREQT